VLDQAEPYPVSKRTLAAPTVKAVTPNPVVVVVSIA